MTFVVLCEVCVLIAGILVVAAGIHIRAVAPAKRRNAWLTFGTVCMTLAACLVAWKQEHDSAAQGTNPMVTGWGLAVVVLVLIGLGIGSIGYLIRELRHSSVRPTTSEDVPLEV